MSLELYFHPLASFCHKALIAFYEKNIPFEPIIVDLGDEKSSAAFRKLGECTMPVRLFVQPAKAILLPIQPKG